MLKICYLAAPCSAKNAKEQEQNLTKAIDTQVALMKKGYIVICPTITGITIERAFDSPPFSWGRWILDDTDLLSELPSTIFFFAGSSRGTEIERFLVKSQGRPIYTDLELVPTIPSRDCTIRGSNV